MNNPPRAQNQATRRQHYVWRHYLEAWQFKADQTNCLRDQRIFTTNLINIMVERDFYKLSLLTQLDIAFLELFLEKIPSEELRTLNRSLIRQLGLMPRLNELIQRGNEFSDAEKQAAQAAVIETEEWLHSKIEHRASPILDDLRQKRADFLDDEEQAITFFHYVAHQYMRTKRIRGSFARSFQRATTATTSAT